MALTNSIDSYFKPVTEEYSVSASVGENGLSTTKVTGDRDGEAFKDTNKMDKDSFLLLLTAQMQNQDPLDPMDNTEYVAQLAQFSQLESTNNMESSLEDVTKTFSDSLAAQNLSAQSVTNASAVSLVGKKVRLVQKSFNYNGGKPKEFTVQMGNKDSVDVEILNKEGDIVKTINVTNKDATNAGKFTWNGYNDNGIRVPADDYALYVNGQEADSSLYCFVEDTVSGIRYDGEKGSLVKVAGQEMSIGDIMEINVDDSTADNGSGFESLTMGQALGLVGKEVKVVDTQTSYSPKSGREKNYSIDMNGSRRATVVVKNSKGVVQQRLPIFDGEGKIMEPFSYDGNKIVLDLPTRDFDGSSSYSVTLESDGAYFYKSGEISGVLSTDSGAKLKVDGMQISLKDIVEISDKG